MAQGAAPGAASLQASPRARPIRGPGSPEGPVLQVVSGLGVGVGGGGAPGRGRDGRENLAWAFLPSLCQLRFKKEGVRAGGGGVFGSKAISLLSQKKLPEQQDVY